MLTALRARQPGTPIYRILWWHVLHLLSYYWVTSCYRYRAWGVRHVPADGPVLLVSNHQSFLDPILVGLACHHRQFYAMARSTLFKRRVFAWLIRSLNAVPVRQGQADKAAMRQCLDMLQRGHALLIFPEGGRTFNGATQRFAPGTMLLIRRARAQVVPVAIEGAFAAWPRKRARPQAVGRIGVQYGRPIAAATLLAMGSEKALAELENRIETMRLGLADRMDRS